MSLLCRCLIHAHLLLYRAVMLFTKVKYKGVALGLPYISPVWCVESVVWNICLL